MENKNYIVVTSSESCARWLNEFGDDLGNLMYIDTLDIERDQEFFLNNEDSGAMEHA